ncbi:MAG: GlsB/YeaQ/YmgE family stress response membrane protein [Myxococcota bacterium]
MDLETVLIILLVGAIIGWLAGFVLQGSGFGLIGNIVVGLLGSFLGSWLLPRLGVHFGSGLGFTILTGVIGAVVLLIVLGILRRLFWRPG